MENTTDLLQIKITEAREKLSKQSRNAIDSVNWKLIILELNKKYSPEQLENLEIETELLLCGLLNTENYLKELEERMKISKTEVDLVVNQMNELVFKKIQEKLIKNIDEYENKINEFKNNFGKTGLLGRALSSTIKKKDYSEIHNEIFESAGIEIRHSGIEEEKELQGREELKEISAPDVHK